MKEGFYGEVIEFFPFPRKDGFIVSVDVGKNRPLIGDYVEFSSKDIWQVKGIVLAGIDKQRNELLEKKRKCGTWDLYLKPVLSNRLKPIMGKVRFSQKLPPSIILNQN